MGNSVYEAGRAGNATANRSNRPRPTKILGGLRRAAGQTRSALPQWLPFRRAAPFFRSVVHRSDSEWLDRVGSGPVASDARC
jgi:hypothetical protein